MQRYEFWHTQTDAITWSFDRPPRLGEEIILGESIYRVTAPRPNAPGSPASSSFECTLVRPATTEEQRAAFKRGINYLPPL
jgi:hypothetical protein